MTDEGFRTGRRASDRPLGTVEEESEAVLEAIAPLPPADRRASGLIRSGAIVAIAMGVSNLLNVVFQLVTARLLPPAEYSLLVTMFAIVLIANVPILSLQAKVAREVAHALARGNRAEAGGLLLESLRPLARWGGIVLALGLAAAIPFALIFNVDRELPVLAVSVAVMATVPLPIAWGGLQGEERFASLGASQLVYAVLKVGAGITLAALGFGASAIVFGIGVATLATIAFSLWPLAGLLRAGREISRRRRRLLDSYTAGAALVLSLIAALTNMDLLASRAFLDNTEAGIYAAVGVAARSMLLLPIVATTVLFPRVAVLRDLAAERNHLLGGLAAVAALGLVPLVLFFAIPEQLIELGFGEDYVGGADWLGPLAAAMLIYALVEVYMFHFLALGRVRYAAVLGGGVALQVVLYAFLHGDPDQIILVQIVVAAVLLIASELFDRQDRRGRRAEEES
jgi:O-antigen/teichoic acid export membrane protein